jgi:arylsulfatase A-like enzyme
MRWPGVIEPERVDNTLLSSIDLVPTVLDVLDLPIPENVHGRSYASLLYGESCKPRDEIFAEKTHHVMFDPIRCVRTSRYKFIDNVTVARRHELPACCEMDVEAIVPELCQFPRPTIELYDLESDPTERHNVAGEERYAKVEQDLRDRLRAWQRHTDDPLLRGVIPLPPRR